jgi:hypothetical protein
MSNIHNICRGHQGLPLSPNKTIYVQLCDHNVLSSKTKKIYFVPGAAFELKQNQ